MPTSLGWREVSREQILGKNRIFQWYQLLIEVFRMKKMFFLIVTIIFFLFSFVTLVAYLINVMQVPDISPYYSDSEKIGYLIGHYGGFIVALIFFGLGWLFLKRYRRQVAHEQSEES